MKTLAAFITTIYGLLYACGVATILILHQRLYDFVLIILFGVGNSVAYAAILALISVKLHLTTRHVFAVGMMVAAYMLYIDGPLQ